MEVKSVLAGVVHAYVHVQLLFTQNEAVGNAESMVPILTRKVGIRQAENGLDVAGVQAIRTLFQLPPGDPGEAVLVGENGRGTENRKDKGNPTANGLATVKH